MQTPPVSSLKSSSGSKSGNDGCSPLVPPFEGRASFLRSSWISRLIPELPLPISWAKVPRSVAGAEDEDTDNKSLSLSPLFQYQRQLANNFLGNSRVDVPPSSSPRVQSDTRPAEELISDRPTASSSVQRVTRRTDSAAYQESPASSRIFRDHRQAFYQNNLQNNKRQTPGYQSEQEENFSFWNMGRNERSNYVSSAAPVRVLNMAHSRKRTLNSYDLVSSKYRKRGSSED